jgi:hypothetical protein
VVYNLDILLQGRLLLVDVETSGRVEPIAKAIAIESKEGDRRYIS